MTPLVIGFLAILLLFAAVVVDASVAYLRREQLDALADGAALAATEGIAGDRLYAGALGDRAPIDAVAAQRYAAEYVSLTGAERHFPGLRWGLTVSGRTVAVRVSAPLRVPFTVPGSERAVVTGSAAATVVVVGG